MNKTHSNSLLFSMAMLLSLVFTLPTTSWAQAQSLADEVAVDYSTAGYRQSDADLPVVKGVVKLTAQSNLMTLDYPGSMPLASDRSGDIQAALDYVASLPLDANGHRGAVVLARGEYLLEQPLRIMASGVVLRGEKKEEVRLVKRGYDRGAVIYVEGGANGDMLLAQAKDDLGAEDRKIAESGVEQLTIVSEYDATNDKDEDHAWTGIYVDHARDCWVRDVDFQWLAGSAVVLHSGVERTTVDNCRSLEPISELGGLRRRAFLTFGHQTLFIRCYAEGAIHAFAAGMGAVGPNAFVQCEAKDAISYSGSIGSGATELLFDIVDIIGNDLLLGNLATDKQQAGWNASASTLWQCSAAVVHVESIDSAGLNVSRNADARSLLAAPADRRQNAAYGCHGQFWGNGTCKKQNDHISPRSLFLTQLNKRGVQRNLNILPRNLQTSTSPTIELAQQLAAATVGPLLTLNHWIDSVSQKTRIGDNIAALPLFDKAVHKPEIGDNSTATAAKGKASATAKKDEKKSKKAHDIYRLTGGRQSVQWWNGNLGTKWLSQSKAHLTRFVPDMEGQGLTDRLDSVIAEMKRKGNIILEHNYGLWYDRRRDDHTRVKRRDGDVWAPFYEQPFARSGEGTAWDGLSLYDLNKPNRWYWQRLQQFATKAEGEGIMLFLNHYFQHNIIEAGAHWVDSPWRTANNRNNTGFTEPVHFSGDKRIFQAAQFYDTAHAERRQLHRQYIRECLNRFADNANVVHFISAEYTGPQHFMEFWLDVIAEWQSETGKNAVVALSCTKDVQDAILADERRAAVVDIIDIRYWHYREDGTLYAPPGGKNMAPRQFARQEKPGKMGYAGAYKSVREYAKRYPKKKVMLSAQDYKEQSKATKKAGGVWYR